MSWTESYPVLTQEMVDEFMETSTPGEQAELESFYRIRATHNPQTSRHLLSVSLSSVTEPENPAEPEGSSRSTSAASVPDPAVWLERIQPLLEDTADLLKRVHDVTVRVYLAGDLDFLVPVLTGAGCEVCLMSFSSGNPAPASTWRLLALSEAGRLVTIVDPEMIKDADLGLERTRAMEQSGLGCWRQPLPVDHDGSGSVIYRPFMTLQLGFQGGWDIQPLLHAFIWHSMRGNIPMVVEMPGCSPKPVNWGHWPDVGFHEWFLAVAMYPRLASAGMLTFVPAGFHSSLLLLDVEYATWSNPQSELIIFPVTGCCGPPLEAQSPSAVSGARPDKLPEPVTS